MNDRLIKLALDCGATKATVIDVKDMVLSSHFRDVCETNGCGMCGRCWMCPPDVAPIDELMSLVLSYKKALVFQTVTELEDSFDIEGMGEAGKNMTCLCQKIRKETGFLADRLVLSAGGCRVCERCTRLDGIPCRCPDEAFLSLEVCGVDVYNTVKPTELKYINGADTVTFFGMVLYKEQ